MSETMGIFRTMVGIESLRSRGQIEQVAEVMVDTGSELTWIPEAVLERLGIPREKTMRFRLADGRLIERSIGYALVHAGGAQAADDVVFAEPNDSVLLGARSIEGLNLRVDLANKQFVSAGPMWAAVGL